MKSNRYNPFPLATMVSHYELGPVFGDMDYFWSGDGMQNQLSFINKLTIHQAFINQRWIIDEWLTNQ